MAYDFSLRKHLSTDVVRTTGFAKLNNFVDDVQTASNELLNKVETHTHSGATGSVAISICTSTTRPDAPALGELIVETDTERIYRCDDAIGPVWVEMANLYYKDVAGTDELHVKTPNDTEIQLTSEGGLNVVIPESATTGEIKQGIFTSLSGWVLLNGGTIGSSASAATNRANDDTETLFKLLWNNISDTWAPVVGGRGGDDDSDWTNNKAITLLPALGRTLIAAGSGAGLTTRALGETGGAEDHQLTEAEMAAHIHSITGTVNVGTGGSLNAGSNYDQGVHNTDSTGGDEAHNNMQPFLAVNVFLKL